MQDPDQGERLLRNLSGRAAILFDKAAIAVGGSEMDKFWEKMTLDEKCDQLRARLEMLAVEMANDNRRLNDRLVKLEQATFQQQQPKAT